MVYGVWGGNIVDDTVEGDELEKTTSKGMILLSKKNEKKDAEAIAMAPNITEEEVKNIKYKLSKREDITTEERLAFEKYNITDNFVLLNPNDPQTYIMIKEVKYPKMLVSELANELIRIDNPTNEKLAIDRVINKIANINHTDPTSNNKIETQFDKMDNCDKALAVFYLVSFLRLFGFSRSLFDSTTIEMKTLPPEKGKNALVEYINKNKQSISYVFDENLDGKKITSQLIVRWLNSKLKLLLIKITATNGHSTHFYIDTPWRITIDIRKEEIVVKHFPLETDILLTQYYGKYIETIKDAMKVQHTPITIIKPVPSSIIGKQQSIINTQLQNFNIIRPPSLNIITSTSTTIPNTTI